MDMKKILQAMDGVATKPVVGVDSMAKFLRVVDEAAINGADTTPAQQQALAPYLVKDPDGSQYYDYPSTDPKEKGAVMGTTIKGPEYLAHIKSPQGQAEVIKHLLTTTDPKNAVPQATVTNTSVDDKNVFPDGLEENTLRKFLSIVTESNNRLSVAEQMVVREYTPSEHIPTKVITSPVLNKGKNEYLIKEYVDLVLKERAEELAGRQAAIRERAARVVKRMQEGTKVTKVDPAAKTVTYTDDQTNVTTTIPQNMAKPEEGGKVAVSKTAMADEPGNEIKPGMDVDMQEVFQNDESNLWYIYHNGRLKQRMIHNDEERAAHNHGYRDSIEGALRTHNIIRSKFDPNKFVQKQGTKWVQVYPFGQPEQKADQNNEPESNHEGDEKPMEGLRTENPCWKGYHPVGTKKKGGRTVPNCVPNNK